MTTVEKAARRQAWRITKSDAEAAALLGIPVPRFYMWRKSQNLKAKAKVGRPVKR